MKRPTPGITAGLCIVLTMICLALPQRGLLPDTGSEAGAFLYSATCAPGLLATLHNAGRERAMGGTDLSPAFAPTCAVLDATLAARPALIQSGGFPSAPHSPSILSLLRQLLI